MKILFIQMFQKIYLIFNDDNDNNENELSNNNNNVFDFEKEIKEAENIINDNKKMKLIL